VILGCVASRCAAAGSGCFIDVIKAMRPNSAVKLKGDAQGATRRGEREVSARPAERRACDPMAYEARVAELLISKGEEAENSGGNFAAVTGRGLKTSASIDVELGAVLCGIPRSVAEGLRLRLRLRLGRRVREEQD